MNVINLFAGPGAGKSTTAALVFGLLKLEGVNAELVREYAKDVVWEGRTHVLDHQAYVFAKQSKRLRDLDGKVDVVVTDSPVMLSNLYGHAEPPEFHRLVEQEARRYPHRDVWVRRVKPYHPEGRLQTEAEAHDLDARLRELVGAFDLEVDGNLAGAHLLAEAVTRWWGLAEGGSA